MSPCMKSVCLLCLQQRISAKPLVLHPIVLFFTQKLYPCSYQKEYGIWFDTDSLHYVLLFSIRHTNEEEFRTTDSESRNRRRLSCRKSCTVARQERADCWPVLVQADWCQMARHGHALALTGGLGHEAPCNGTRRPGPR